MPVHIMDLNVNEMDANDDGDNNNFEDKIQTPTYTSTPQQSYRNGQPADDYTSITTTTNANTNAITTSSSSVTMQQTSSTSRLPQNVLNSNVAIIDDDSHNNLVLNDRVTSISVIEPNDTARKLFIDTNAGSLTPSNINHNSNNNPNNNITKPVILVDTTVVDEDVTVGGSRDDTYRVGGDGQRSGMADDAIGEKGYFEKTIINKNGIFIENIRKLTNIDQRILGGSSSGSSDFTTSKQKSSSSGMDIDNYDDGGDDMDDSDNDGADDIAATGSNANSTPKLLSMDNMNGKINSKSIELMNHVPVAHAEHYVITSSGKIEKTDDVIAQFQGGLNANTNINSQNNNRVVNSNTNAATAAAAAASTSSASAANNNKINVRQQYTHQTIQPQSDGNFAVSSAATAPILSSHIETYTGGNLLSTTNSVSSEPNACIVMGM